MHPQPRGLRAVLPAFGRLRFGDDLEPGFRQYFAAYSLPLARFALILAVLLYALFGILDVYIVPSATRWIWLIRYAVFCPAALAVLGLTFSRRLRPAMQPVLCGIAVLAGFGIVAMIAVARPSAGYLYYAGLLLVVPWAYTLLRLRFGYATGACLAIVAGYEVVAVVVKHTPVQILVNNNFFFVSATVIGMAAGYTIERGLRTEFVQRQLIESQRSELARHNAQLDSALRDSLQELRVKAEELQASRARIVTAADAERRRIERDLHDGAQQQLTALSVKMRLACELAGPDGDLGGLLADLCDEVTAAARELRNLAHGIYPPLLASSGLAAALSAAARRCPLPATVQAAAVGRYPAGLEAAVYFCCLEAVQNVWKHAGQRATVRLGVAEQDGMLRFEVADDGAGFDARTHGLGAGFLNMADRLGAFGGKLDVGSAPGAGTRVTGSVPLHGSQTAVTIRSNTSPARLPAVVTSWSEPAL